MDLPSFAAFHLPALEADEVRFNLQIAVIATAAQEPVSGFVRWTLGGPGHCATMSPGRSILLGKLDAAECRELARVVRTFAYPGVVGAGRTVSWFAEQAIAQGATFNEMIPQCIHVLPRPPRHPGVGGSARPVTWEDTSLLWEWLLAFHREAIPHDPPPEKASVERLARSDRVLLWTRNNEPVSMAAIARRLNTTGVIAPVYTPPAHRGKGYAASVTAAVADRILSEGKSCACLYTDLRNAASNRCYAKIGFEPYCESWHYLRAS